VAATPTASDSASSHKPATSILRSARSMNWLMVASGLATVSTPITRPASVTGAATYITELRSSVSTSRVARAPYSPRRVRATSRQRE